MDDLISRQAAIEVLRNRWLKTRNYDGIGEDIAEECEIYLKTLPSAQPETCAYWDSESNYCALHRPSAQPETHEERTKTHACDLIDRQAAIDEAYEIIIDGQKFEVVQVETLMGLPPASAQAEIIHCCECRYWKPGYITDDDDFVPPGCAVGWVAGVWRATDYCSNAERRQVCRD